MYVVNGIWNIEVFFLLVVIKRFGIALELLTLFIDRCVVPKQLGGSARQACSSVELNKLLQTGDHFKCSASDALTLYPLFAVFLETFVVPKGVCADVLESYMALKDVLDLLSVVRFGGVSATQLDDAIQKHLFLFTTAYNSLGIKPKHHFALHLPEQLARFGTLIGH